MILSSKTFSVNSRVRESGTNTDFSYILDLPPNNRFNRVCILDFSCPKSWYLIPENENYFFITDNQTEYKIELIPGNYNRKNLTYQLNNGLLPGGMSIGYANSAVEGDDGKFTITGHGNHPHKIRFEEYMWEIMGFEANTEYDFDLNNGSAIKSRNVVSFQKENTIKLHSNICDNNGTDVLLNIYGMANLSFSTIVWHLTDIDAHSRMLTTNQNNIYNFRITNEDNHILSTNGLNCVFSIIVYEQSPIYRMLNGYIKYRVGQDEIKFQKEIEPEEKKKGKD